jgi:hypothetical protein
MNEPTRVEWRRQLGSVALTLGVIAVLVALQTIHEFNADLRRDAAGLYFSEALFLFLPIGAALLAGQLARLDMRALAVTTAAITVMMIGQDFLPASELTSFKRGLVYQASADYWTITDQGDVLRWAEGGALPVVVTYLSGGLPAADEEGVPIPEGAPRIQAAWSLFKAGYLFAPFIAVGFVVAIRTWIGANLRFRTRSSERIFHVAVSWVVGPLVPLFLLEVNDLALFWALEQFGLASALIPPIAFGIAAGFGWRAGIRAERRTAFIHAGSVRE